MELCLREVHAVSRPGDVVGEVGGVDGGEGGGVQHQEVGLLLLSVIPDGDQHSVILRGAPGARQEVHLTHVVVLPVENLDTSCCNQWIHNIHIRYLLSLSEPCPSRHCRRSS